MVSERLIEEYAMSKKPLIIEKSDGYAVLNSHRLVFVYATVFTV